AVESIPTEEKMSPSTRAKDLLAITVLTLLATAAARAEENALELCLARAADASPVYPTQLFPAGTKDTVVTFRVPKGTYSKLQATWTAVDVEKAPSPNLKIGSLDLALQGHDRGSMRLDFPKAMPPGKYRVDVAADGKPWKSVDFSVAAKEPVVKSRGEE